MSELQAAAGQEMSSGAVWCAMAPGSTSANRIVQYLGLDGRGRPVIHYRTSHGPRQCSQLAWDAWVASQGARFVHVSAHDIHHLICFDLAAMARVAALAGEDTAAGGDALLAAVARAACSLRDDVQLKVWPHGGSHWRGRVTDILYEVADSQAVAWQDLALALAGMLRPEMATAPKTAPTTQTEQTHVPTL